MEALPPTTCRLKVSASNTITLEDVLVGEVWVGSGQSNMAGAVRSYTKADPVLAQAAAASYPRLRLIRAKSSYRPGRGECRTFQTSKRGNPRLGKSLLRTKTNRRPRRKQRKNVLVVPARRASAFPISQRLDVCNRCPKAQRKPRRGEKGAVFVSSLRLRALASLRYE